MWGLLLYLIWDLPHGHVTGRQLTPSHVYINHGNSRPPPHPTPHPHPTPPACWQRVARVFNQYDCELALCVKPARAGRRRRLHDLRHEFYFRGIMEKDFLFRLAACPKTGVLSLLDKKPLSREVFLTHRAAP